MPEPSAALLVPTGTSDAFLSLKTKRAGKIKGEAQAPGHEEDIVLSSWSWGLSAASAVGSTQATARRSYKALTLGKSIDRASTSLLSALATNDEVKEAKLAIRRSGGEQVDYYVITLERGRITAVDQGLDADGHVRETLVLSFNKIEIAYFQQERAGQAGAASMFTDEIHP